MSRYLLPCSCGQKTPVFISAAGTEVTCVCGKILPVPSIRGLRELELEALKTADSPRPTTTYAGWDIRGIVFVIGLLAALVGFGLAGWHGYVWSQVDTTNHEHVFLEEIEHRIDEQSPLQLLDIWKHVTKDGLGDYEEPLHRQWQKISDDAWQMLQVGVLMVVGGVAAVGYSLFAGTANRRKT